MSRNVEQFRTGIPWTTETEEPVTTTTANGLSIIHKRKVVFLFCMVMGQFRPTGATATVSTLATVVGQPKTPTSAGKGGFKRGFPCLPSKDSMRAVSSPQM